MKGRRLVAGASAEADGAEHRSGHNSVLVYSEAQIAYPLQAIERRRTEVSSMPSTGVDSLV